MKLQMVETLTTTGEWIYVYDCKDGPEGKEIRDLIHCISIGGTRTREQAIELAEKLMGFYALNKGKERILKEFEYSEI
jgi:hypothetical protein